MDFTREPIVESVITPKEGYKLVIRSSKGLGQEEFLVDSVEVVTFGGSCFYRSLERPKCFLVPIGDYELIEVRETRMVLKTAQTGGERSSIKISANRSAPAPVKEKEEGEEMAEPAEPRQEKGKRRRQSRRRRNGREETQEVASNAEAPSEEGIDTFMDMLEEEIVEGSMETTISPPPAPLTSPAPVKTLLPPPKRLISDTIARYKEDEKFKGAFMSPSEMVKEVQGEEVQGEVEESEPELPFVQGDGLSVAGNVSETISEENRSDYSTHWIIPEIGEESSAPTSAVQKNGDPE